MIPLSWRIGGALVLVLVLHGWGWRGGLAVAGEQIGELLRWGAAFLVLGSFWQFYEGCQLALQAFISGG
ncbi:hypothetical protein ASD91_27745 [Pseudomonas sp. Root68]|uniref:hypothetical protein n=1 Tax=unclassified Pseudomonas TaxID=196821 RepID=UPI0006FAD180|nr:MULTISPECIES: hypothetical protein [unclassified Pseudomonas]KRA97206.1 hypothetical protein ASD91_27745 [Pseudomonas sp. Root68]KRB67019.1 hypothetical protein ASD95_27745 [Pseudomonas sp. Root71]